MQNVDISPKTGYKQFTSIPPNTKRRNDHITELNLPYKSVKVTIIHKRILFLW